MQLWLALLFAFLIGGIPFGFLAVRLLRGQDVRKTGSGNIGATNASRCFEGSWRWFAFVAIYVLDFSKGYLPVALWAGLYAQTGEPDVAGPALAAATVLGHCFTPYLAFKGGKGVATGGGAIFALEPFAVGIGLAVFFVTLLLTKVVALGSIALGFVLALVIVFRDLDSAFSDRIWVSAVAIALAIFLVWTHRSNIRKLLGVDRRARESNS